MSDRSSAKVMPGMGLLGHSAIVLLILSVGCVSVKGAIAQETQTQPSRTIVRPVLSQGSQGTEVLELQAALKLLGYYSGEVDGIFADGTAIAVSRFQQAAGLESDGVVGQNTWYRLFPPVPFIASTPSTPTPPVIPPDNTFKPDPPTTAYPILRRGMSGPEVERLQELLQTIGIYQGGIDGDFGPETEAAVIEAQASYGLEPDGIVGPSTWDALRQ